MSSQCGIDQWARLQVASIARVSERRLAVASAIEDERPLRAALIRSGVGRQSERARRIAADPVKAWNALPQHVRDLWQLHCRPDELAQLPLDLPLRTGRS